MSSVSQRFGPNMTRLIYYYTACRIDSGELGKISALEWASDPIRMQEDLESAAEGAVALIEELKCSTEGFHDKDDEEVAGRLLKKASEMRRKYGF